MGCAYLHGGALLRPAVPADPLSQLNPFHDIHVLTVGVGSESDVSSRESAKGRVWE